VQSAWPPQHCSYSVHCSILLNIYTLTFELYLYCIWTQAVSCWGTLSEFEGNLAPQMMGKYLIINVLGGTCRACDKLFGMTTLEHCCFLADSGQCLRAADWILNAATQHSWCSATCFGLLRWFCKQDVAWNIRRSSITARLADHRCQCRFSHFTQLWCMYHVTFTVVAPWHSFSSSTSTTKQARPINTA